MKSNKIIYWVSTAILGLMMLFSAYSYFTNPEMAQAFQHFGFPNYFRIELGTAKILGALVLLIPQIPARIKEWSYAGFAITFISAAIAHYSSGDPFSVIIMPITFLIILVVSYIYFHKTRVA
jgi:hypothetical protein